jgi:hypothetical protein
MRTQRHLFWLLILLCVSNPARFAHGQAGQEPELSTGIAGEREAGRELKQQLARALAGKSARLVISPGIYRLSPDAADLPHLVFRHVSNFELDGAGVTLICESINSAIYIESCQNMTIKGLTIDYDPLPMTQGTITAVSPNSLDFKIHAGYPLPNYDGIGVGHIWIADAATREVKPGSVNYGHPKEIVNTGDGTYRLLMKGGRHDSVQPGDLIKLPQRLNLKAPHAVRVDGSKAITFENVTIESAPCFGFVSTWGDGIVLDHVKVVPGPPPPGATEPRIFSSSADGINMENDARGPSIRNCKVISNGDDGIAIYNMPDLVLAQDGSSSLIIGLNNPNPRQEAYAPGDRVRLFLFGHGIEERKIIAVEPSADSGKLPPYNRVRYSRLARVTVDTPVTAAPGDRVLDTRYEGAGFEIANNMLINNASRGINVNQSGGRVFENHISHSFLPGIHMTEFMRADGGGSGFQKEVEILNNVISDACIGFPQRKDWQGAICIVASDSKAHFEGHEEISIVNNVIERPNGIGIQAQCARNVKIWNNTIASPAKAGRAAAAILLDDVHAANLRNNVLSGAGWNAPTTELRMLPSCSGIVYELPIDGHVNRTAAPSP